MKERTFGKKKWKKCLGLIFLFVLLLSQGAYAKVPGLSAKITKNNILSVADAYDKEGAYILRSSVNSGEDILQWWFGEDSIVSGIDTAVHEEFHAYSFRNVPYDAENIYLGNGKSARITITNVYRSRLMGATIPRNLRTVRWSTYVGNPSANMASDMDGIYGLLNEFTAYYWGMHTELAMFSYLKDQNAGPSEWCHFAMMCANDRLAYAEFKYYMLNYLAYAKKNYPAVYQGIINNKNFVSTYTTIEANYAKLIQKFEQRLKDIKTIMEAKGYEVVLDDGNIMILKNGSGRGMGLFQDEYNSLIKEIGKSTYQNLLKGTGKTATAKAPAAPAKTSITSIKAKSTGIQIKWKASKGASGYYVYRKAKGESAYKKVKTTTGTSWTDKTAKSAKLYSYKIVPYAKSSAGKITKASASGAKSMAWVKASSISAVKRNSKTKMSLKWQRSAGVSGYQIMYAQNSKFTSAKTVNAKASSTSAAITKLKNKAYYVRIRAYWKNGGTTYYSAWSTAKKVSKK